MFEFSGVGDSMQTIVNGDSMTGSSNPLPEFPPKALNGWSWLSGEDIPVQTHGKTAGSVVSACMNLFGDLVERRS